MKKVVETCVAFSVYCRQGMFAGSGLQGKFFVEILRLCLISVVKMPKISRIGVAVVPVAHP